ncbi:MAG: hypothetical protein QNJ68_14490 [Microcoleaceae cyanobacterium MO_207.B10]|nr:hypothetical protein [Microcoleaceae cyanobacterium MO_207.B10]
MVINKGSTGKPKLFTTRKEVRAFIIVGLILPTYLEHHYANWEAIYQHTSYNIYTNFASAQNNHYFT